MAVGLSGSNASADGETYAEFSTIELRTISALLQQLLGTSQAGDELDRLRNDVAFTLGLASPVPGTGR